MKVVYKGAIDVLIFFFVTDLFASIINVGDGSFYQRFIYAVIFAAVVYVGPHLLMFVKIPVTESSELIITGILSFLFFFLGYYVFGIIDISGYVFNPSIPVLEPVNLVDKSVALFVIGAFAAVLSVGLQAIGSRKKKSYSY